MNNKQIRLQALRAAPDKVDGDVIRSCSIITAGEALGHGVYLDESFISEAFAQSEGMKLGLKARFGHPSMCNESLGTTVGRFKNFKISKDRKQLYGDLHFGSYADEGFKNHILGLAKEDPEAFGTSIVFQVGGHYRKDQEGNDVMVAFNEYGREEYEDYEGDPDELSDELYVVCGKMLGCDFVDEPAANPDGLFSSATPAGQLNKFFSDHPEVKTLLSENLNIVDIIEQYGVNIKEYLEVSNMSEENKVTEEELLEANSDNSHENCEELSEAVVEVEAEEAVGPAEEAEVKEYAEVEEAQVEEMSASEFRGLVTEFGAEIATKVFDSKGSYLDALKLQNEGLKAKVEELTALNEKLTVSLAETEKELSEVSSDGVSFSNGNSLPKKRDIARNVKL